MARKWWVLAAVGCGTFMATLDSSVVNIALPTITEELDSDLARVKWVVITYLLVITCLLLPFGRISDQYGRKATFAIGFLVFTLGSAFCGLSSTLIWLVLSRTVQAVGASMLMANGPAIITSAFPAGERGKALGVMAMVVSAGLICGPSIGGIVIANFGWRTIFLMNIPVGIAGFLLVLQFVKPNILPSRRKPFDLAGAVVQSLVLGAFIFAMDPPAVSISGSPAILVPRSVLIALVVILIAIFLKVESDAPSPIFDLHLLRIRTFWTANLAGFLMFVAYSAIAVLMPFFLEGHFDLEPDGAGLFMSAVPLMIFVVAPVSGRLSDRFGSRGLSTAGGVVLMLSLAAMSGVIGPGVHHSVPPAAIVAMLAISGFALGIFQSPNNNAIMSSVPQDKLGSASAFLATVRNLGLVTGTGIATATYAARATAGSDDLSALRFTFLVASVIALVAAVASLGKEPGPYGHHAQEQPAGG